MPATVVNIPVKLLGAAFTAHLFTTILIMLYTVKRRIGGAVTGVTVGFIAGIPVWYVTLVALGQVIA